MDRTETETGADRDAPGAEGSGAPRPEPQPAPWPAPWPAPQPAPLAEALFRPGRELQGLAEAWGTLRRDAFLLNVRLLGVEARLVAIEGRSTADAHAKLALLVQVLRHDLGLAPDHRAIRLASGALAALECVHRAVEAPEGTARR